MHVRLEIHEPKYSNAFVHTSDDGPQLHSIRFALLQVTHEIHRQRSLCANRVHRACAYVQHVKCSYTTFQGPLGFLWSPRTTGGKPPLFLLLLLRGAGYDVCSLARVFYCVYEWINVIHVKDAHSAACHLIWFRKKGSGDVTQRELLNRCTELMDG